MPLLLKVATGFSAPHLMQTRVSTGGGMLERQAKALRVDLGMDVPGQVVMMLSQIVSSDLRLLQHTKGYTRPFRWRYFQPLHQ